MDDNEELERLLQAALDSGQAPPKAFVSAVMTGQMVIPEKFVSQFVDNGWLPRQRCEVWSRVMGYYRPVSQWNVGKKAEYAERHQLDLAKDISYPVGEETFAIEPDEEPAPYNP